MGKDKKKTRKPECAFLYFDIPLDFYTNAGFPEVENYKTLHLAGK